MEHRLQINGRRIPVATSTLTLAVLTLINLFNYLDRYIISALVEPLKRSELAITDTQAGLLMTGFVVVYILASPFFGVLGDRYCRTHLVAFGVALWSFATVIGGWARGFTSLFLSRTLVGVGEAAYGTIAPAILADTFPVSQRGRMYALFFCAIPIGSALGYIIGGYVSIHFGWRSAFFVAGVPGIFLALGAYFLKDPPRGIQDDVSHGPSLGWKSYLVLFRNKFYLSVILGYAAYTFAMGGLAFWMPAFLERIRGLAHGDATLQFGLVIIVTGFFGTFLGGWVADACAKVSRQGYLWVAGIGTSLSVPFIVAALYSDEPIFYMGATVIAELLLFASTGPINSVIAGAVPAEMRAAAFAGCNFFIHVLGDVPSPPLIGLISDATSLKPALAVVPVATLAAGVIWMVAAWRHDRQV